MEYVDLIGSAIVCAVMYGMFINPLRHGYRTYKAEKAKQAGRKSAQPGLPPTA